MVEDGVVNPSAAAATFGWERGWGPGLAFETGGGEGAVDVACYGDVVGLLVRGLVVERIYGSGWESCGRAGRLLGILRMLRRALGRVWLVWWWLGVGLRTSGVR